MLQERSTDELRKKCFDFIASLKDQHKVELELNIFTSIILKSLELKVNDLAVSWMDGFSIREHFSLLDIIKEKEKLEEAPKAKPKVIRRKRTDDTTLQ